ncbi:cytochrome [Sesamum angolense]|uniref:Cytochrome n=1 Tax=Sesamum angolense TaxID=2727404 RepID=A0AAE1X9A4_9LAMI|nr:cytochrome [Sesamum angolense]
MEIQLLSKLLVSFVFVGVLGLFFRVYNAVVAEPGRLRSTLRKQGLRGPLPTFLLGNILDMKKARDVAAKAGTVNGPPDSHNCGAALLPFFDEWRKKYGDVFLFSLGNTQIVHVTQPEMVREIITCTSLDLGKPTYQAKERRSLLGQGILTSNGPIWAHQRKILAPELYMDKVKGMISLIQDSTITLLNSWRNIVEREGGLADINIDKYMRSFSGDVISGACLEAPTDEEQPGGMGARERDQNFDFECGEGKKRSFSNMVPNAVGFTSRMARTNPGRAKMAINESLRLYPPVSVVSREALKDLKFRSINFPKGVNLWTLVTTLHTDPENWGPDSYQYNPERFANGITGACKLPHLYMPFGVGPRVCLGQNLALVELKILISMILSKFSISLSPNYVHSPALNLVIEPGHGVNLLIKQL